MKAKRPNTDQEVELVAYANGRPCTEYVLPFEKSNAESDTLTCFIPVSAGDQLTITGSFSGSVLKGTFDLLADGSFVVQKRIEPMKYDGGNSMVKYHGKRSLKFEKVLNVSTEPGRTTTLPSDSVSEGNLHVKTIERHHEAGRSVLESRVGSLTVVCSLAQNEEDTHTHSYNSCTCGSWAQRVSELVRKDGSGIQPEYELEFKATSDAVSKSRANKHKQHYREAKCGSRPWATFVFHYRSKTAIDEADCELSPKTSAGLEPADPESFVKGSTDSAKRRMPAKSELEQDETNPMMSGEHSAFMTPPPLAPMVTPASDQLWESNEFIEPRTPATTSSNPLFLTPPPLPKKKKKPEGGSGHTGNAASPPLFERTSMAQDAVPFKTSPQPQSFSSFNRETEMKEEADGHPGEKSLDHSYIMTDEELAQAAAAAEAFLGPTSRAQDEAMEAQVLLPPLDQSYMNSETEAVDIASAAATKHVKTEQTPPRSVRTGNDDQSFHQGTAGGQQQPFNIKAKLVSTSDNAVEEDFRPRSPSDPDLEKAKRAMTYPLLTSHSHSPERSPARSTRSSQGATATGCLLTASDIAEFIPPEGIKLKDLETQFTEEDLPNTLQAKGQFLQLVRGIANNIKDVYFLKPRSQVSIAHFDSTGQQSPQKHRFSFDVNQSSFQEVKASSLEPNYIRRAQEVVDEKVIAPEEVDSFNNKATSELMQPSKAPEKLSQQTLHQQVPLSHSRTSVKPTIEGTTAASERTPISQATPSPTNNPQPLPRKSPATVAADTILHNRRPELTPELPDRFTGGLKRTTSTMTTSRESPPSSKKPKFEELSARKLALQKSLAEKKARKAEARKAFEELQKHREQEEQRRIEAEEREIAMLERMAADEEEEYAELVEATEVEEAAIAEAKLARERAEEAVRLSEGP
ncbi:hypothetical protein KC340_g2099 [Hortaea werneckii]|nr:hypothetical protein KC342_g5109 [Hortaea werneckii]KAI7107426.1 hypothetical protein KC339_g2369 [Hortaea werneckii]KAI7239578.1 hypothetical protein KC365_g4058 [Hortaea werneckii]KAI7335360.1 hypothetical protein KC340_g2099 [Hortaea werneckii]KAI7379615.1 hypothetical protein KC328_g13222 [Hortaea werneckii]